MRAKQRNLIEMILVEPESHGNIGSTARAMNNMGFKHLGLVNPPEDFTTGDAYKMAWKSLDILNTAKTYSSIQDAIQDKRLVIAMTRRKGKDRGRFYTLAETLPLLHQVTDNGGKIAVLFGRESKGLLNEELQYADRYVRIPTANVFGSLNLAQAVLLTCYDIFSFDHHEEEESHFPASRETVEMFYTHLETVLGKIGYGARGSRLHPDRLIKKYRKILGRALPDYKEVQMLRGMCSQIEKALEKKNG